MVSHCTAGGVFQVTGGQDGTTESDETGRDRIARRESSRIELEPSPGGGREASTGGTIQARRHWTNPDEEERRGQAIAGTVSARAPPSTTSTPSSAPASGRANTAIPVTARSAPLAGLRRLCLRRARRRFASGRTQPPGRVGGVPDFPDRSPECRITIL